MTIALHTVIGQGIILKHYKTNVMSNFITRVELYGSPSESVYTNLHAAMIKSGFSRTLEDGGKKYDLPHAMYGLYNSYKATTDVRDIAKTAAISVWKDCAVLVTKTDVRVEFYNLKLTKQ